MKESPFPPFQQFVPRLSHDAFWSAPILQALLLWQGFEFYATISMRPKPKTNHFSSGDLNHTKKETMGVRDQSYTTTYNNDDDITYINSITISLAGVSFDFQ